ncbi:MAG: acetyl-CoA carboxylase biotin carboxyl carrier protein subunit [Planctomycetes bacterium]|nr:acetyl-CoA carboxylase biotin carboxyl carrier protein subunit [Planctomycetota bacterium]
MTNITAPMVGKIMKVNIKPGDKVAANQLLIVFESMKIEMDIYAPAAGTIKEVAVKEGQTVESETLLAVIE